MAASTKRVSSVICGHASRHKQHEIQRERGYACSCTAGVTRGPGPRSYVPSTGTHAFTRFRFSKRILRSTMRSRTTGKCDKGSRRTVSPGVRNRRKHAIADFPLISMAQEPHTSSRQLDSYTIGDVAVPERVIGVAAISIKVEMTFIPERQRTSKSSQYGCESGVACRLILICTGSSGIHPPIEACN